MSRWLIHLTALVLSLIFLFCVPAGAQYLGLGLKGNWIGILSQAIGWAIFAYLPAGLVLHQSQPRRSWHSPAINAIVVLLAFVLGFFWQGNQEETITSRLFQAMLEALFILVGLRLHLLIVAAFSAAGAVLDTESARRKRELKSS